MKSLNKFKKDNSGVVFMTDDKPVASLSVKVEPVADTKAFVGTYNTELAGLHAIVKQNTIILEGCNTHNIPFTLSSSG